MPDLGQPQQEQILQGRDHGLDLLKGAACILMIFSHAYVKTEHPLPLGMAFLGSFAAIYFFSASGVTASFRAERYASLEMLLPLGFLFVLGFSLNGIIEIDFYRHFEMQMLQMIAVGSALVYLVERRWKPKAWVYGVLGIGVFAFKRLLDWTLGDLPLEGAVFAPGTFTFIPWLFLFFLGVYAYRAPNRHNLILAAASVIGIVLGLLVSPEFIAGLFDKWDMPEGYFLLACFFMFLGFYLVRGVPSLRGERNRFLLFLGRNSLLFLYVHILVINAFYRLGLAKNYVLYWLLILVVSALLMVVILRLEHIPFFRVFEKPLPWVLLAAFILAVPAVSDNNTLIFLLEGAAGLIFALNYGVLSRRVFRRPGSA